MRKKIFALLVSVAVIGLLPFAAIGADSGVYIGIGGGATFLNDSSNTRPAIVGQDEDTSYPALDADSSTDAGFAVNGVVGYAFTNGLRVEGEVGYRKNNLDKTNIKSPGALIDELPALGLVRNNPEHRKLLLGEKDADGDVSAITLLFNGYYDIDMGSGLKPYVGGGIGVAFLSAESTSSITGNKIVDDTDTVFAYQVGGGIGYEMTPTTSLSLDYRYFGTQDPALKSELIGDEFDSEYGGHYIGVSIRFWPSF